MRLLLKTLLTLSIILGIAGAAKAQVPTSALSGSDLVLAFQVPDQGSPTASQGDNTDLEVNLGTITTLLANASGGTYTFPSTVLSPTDLSGNYGTTWYTRTSGTGQLTWSVFGSDDADDFWDTRGSVFHEANSSVQHDVNNLMDQVYGDFGGNTSTANSNFSIVSNSQTDGGSYTQSITDAEGSTSDWNFTNFGSTGTQTAAGNTAQIPFFYSAYANSGIHNATEIGTFELNDSGQLSFTLTAVPEPSTWATLLVGATVLTGIRRRPRG